MAVQTNSSTQISGKGFTGTFRLMHPYYPGPRYYSPLVTPYYPGCRELWGKDYVEPKEKGEATPKKAKKEEPASPK